MHADSLGLQQECQAIEGRMCLKSTVARFVPEFILQHLAIPQRSVVAETALQSRGGNDGDTRHDSSVNLAIRRQPVVIARFDLWSVGVVALHLIVVGWQKSGLRFCIEITSPAEQGMIDHK